MCYMPVYTGIGLYNVVYVCIYWYRAVQCHIGTNKLVLDGIVSFRAALTGKGLYNVVYACIDWYRAV